MKTKKAGDALASTDFLSDVGMTVKTGDLASQA